MPREGCITHPSLVLWVKSDYNKDNGTGETTTDVTYTYDEFHRVTSAQELYGNAWREYQYDSLGNLKTKEPSPCL